MKLNYFVILGLLFVFLSCEKEITSGSKEEIISSIAHSISYKNYRLALLENVYSGRSGAYDRKQVINYINTNYPKSDNLCKEDFSNSTIKGLELMVATICDIGLALDQLNQEFPAFNSLTRDEKIKVGNIYSSEVITDRTRDLEILTNGIKQ